MVDIQSTKKVGKLREGQQFFHCAIKTINLECNLLHTTTRETVAIEILNYTTDNIESIANILVINIVARLSSPTGMKHSFCIARSPNQREDELGNINHQLNVWI